MSSSRESAPRPAGGVPDYGQLADVLLWVERAQAGDSDAFGLLYGTYCDTVYRYVYYRVGSKATAEDLTSDTFVRALARLDSFTWRGRDFAAWLVTIARNRVADHFKSGPFHLEVTTGEILDANEVERSTEDTVLNSLDNGVLAEALNRLPGRMRQVIRLWALDTPTADIGRQLHISSSTVRVHLHQARQRLAADPALCPPTDSRPPQHRHA
ncbi:sigma-70 family RNA polymerase sigma factor [Streptomyces sp. NPDC002668]|uniref:sigma-70 family RNA polymerase sigma factor n=1 Tax=Streptomyces sp. NPDC002668 TaxID=3154422 RepID=UPI00333134B1